jgi:hypothetical protein
VELHRCPPAHTAPRCYTGAEAAFSRPGDVGSFVNRCFECHEFVLLIQHAADRPTATPRPSTRSLLSALRLALTDAKFSLPAFVCEEASEGPASGRYFGVSAFPSTTWFETATLALPAQTVDSASEAAEASSTGLMRRIVVEVVRSRMCRRPQHRPGSAGAAVDLALDVGMASTPAPCAGGGEAPMRTLRFDVETLSTSIFPCRRVNVPVGAAEPTDVSRGLSRLTLWQSAAGRRHVAAVQLQCARKDEQLHHIEQPPRLLRNPAATRPPQRPRSFGSSVPAPSPDDGTFRLSLQWEEVPAASDIIEMLAIWLQQLLRLKRGGSKLDASTIGRHVPGSIADSDDTDNDASETLTKQVTPHSGPNALLRKPLRTATAGGGGGGGGGAPPQPLDLASQRPRVEGDSADFLLWERDWRQAAVASPMLLPDHGGLSLNEHLILSIAAWAMRHAHLPLANVTSSWADLINQLSVPYAAMSAAGHGVGVVIQDADRYPCIQRLFAVSVEWARAFAAATPGSGTVGEHPALRLSARTIVDIAVQSLLTAIVISAHQLLQELSDAQDTPSAHGRSSVAAAAHGDLVRQLGRLVSTEQPATGVGVAAAHAYIGWVSLLGEVDATMAACRELQRIWSPTGQDWRALDAGAFPTRAGAFMASKVSHARHDRHHTQTHLQTRRCVWSTSSRAGLFSVSADAMAAVMVSLGCDGLLRGASDEQVAGSDEVPVRRWFVHSGSALPQIHLNVVVSCDASRRTRDILSAWARPPTSNWRSRFRRMWPIRTCG